MSMCVSSSLLVDPMEVPLKYLYINITIKYQQLQSVNLRISPQSFLSVKYYMTSSTVVALLKCAYMYFKYHIFFIVLQTVYVE